MAILTRISGSTGDSTGNLSFGLKAQEVMYFPEVEANYSHYPQKVSPSKRLCPPCLRWETLLTYDDR